MATWTKNDTEAFLNSAISNASSGDDGTTTPWPSSFPTPTHTSTPQLTPSVTPSPSEIDSYFGTDTATDLFDKALEAIKEQQKNAFSGSSSSDLSTGAIIGIMVGCVGVVALIAMLVLRRRLKAKDQQQNPNFVGHNSDTVSFVGASSPRSGKNSAGDGNNRRNPGRTNGDTGLTTRTLTNTSSSDHQRTGTNHSTGNNRTAKSDASILILAGSGAVSLWEDEAIVTARIPKDKVLTTSLISRGGYGEVYAGVYNGQRVAIKTLLPETKKNLKQINAFLSEVKLMAALDHERIVAFIGVAWDSLMDLCVVCELMDGGDLRGLLTNYGEQNHPHGFDSNKIRIALHVAHALTYLHSLQPLVLHRDLKSKNILLDSELNAKVTDFGVSRERGDATMTANVGTSLWMAPEVMVGERYDQKADMFSFGIVLSELDSHQLPYAEKRETPTGHRIPDAAMLQMVAMGRMQVQWSQEATAGTPEIVDLGRACLALDATARPTASEALYKLHMLLRDRSGTVSGFV